jgi:hypothetical protein
MHRLLAPDRNRRQSGRWQVALALAIAAAAAVAVSGCGGSSSGASSTRYSAPARHAASAGNPLCSATLGQPAEHTSFEGVNR